jgi:predicted regulator of Ras-like GTPase activity (Roadblock/LC7/MglB family)
MFNFLKKWLPTRNADVIEAQPEAPNLPVPEALSEPPSTVPEPTPDPPHPPLLPEISLESPISSAPENSAHFLLIPRAVVIHHLPSGLRRHTDSTEVESNEPIPFPLDTILHQLRLGRFSCSIREVQQLAPGLVESISEQEKEMHLVIPLSKILPLLPTGALNLHSAPPAPGISPEIPAIFGPESRRVKSPQTAAPQGKTSPEIPAAPVSPREPEMPIASAPPVALAETIAPAEPSSPAPIAFKLAPAPAPATQCAPIAWPHSQIPATPPRAEPVEETPLIAQPAAASEATPVRVAIPCAKLIQSWPELVRKALAGLDLADRALHVSLEDLEPRLRRGKVEFSWGQLQNWIVPPIANLEDVVSSELLIELPLPVVAPLFLAKRPAPSPKERNAHPAESVPELFFRGRTKVEPEPNSAGIEPEPSTKGNPAAPAGPNASTPIPLPDSSLPAGESGPRFAPALNGLATKSAVNSKPTLNFGEIFGKPNKSHWKPEEIMVETANLKGVAGALLTTTDGLLIGGKLPGDLNGEKVAAFVPQMFGRLSQYARELQFPEPRQLSISLDNIPLQIHQIEKTLFMVLGRAGENLPRIQISAVASQLQWQAENNLFYGNHQSNNPGTSG